MKSLLFSADEWRPLEKSGRVAMAPPARMFHIGKTANQNESSELRESVTPKQYNPHLSLHILMCRIWPRVVLPTNLALDDRLIEEAKKIRAASHQEG